MVSIDGSVIVQIINFIFLILVLNIIVYKPIRNILAQRKERIDDLEASIKESEGGALSLDGQYNTGIKSAREAGIKEKDAFIQIAAEEEKAIIKKINEKAQKNLMQIREKIAKDTEDARKASQKDVDVFAEAIGQKILGRTI